MKDLFDRTINYLRISITDSCNLNCKYCRPGIHAKDVYPGNKLKSEELETIVKCFLSLGINKIRITGGEPLVQKNILNLVDKIGGLDGIKDFAMTTNGVLLKHYASDLKSAGLQRINISLDTLDKARYFHITGGGNLDHVLDGIEEAKKVGLEPIKLNVVLIKGFNEDEIEGFVDITMDESIDVRFIELMPVGDAWRWSSKNYISTQTVLEKVKALKRIYIDDVSSPASYYRLTDGRGRVGLINPISCKFCKSCNRIRLTMDGKLKLCLHSNNEIDLIKHLRNGDDIRKIITDAVSKKPGSHGLNNGEYISKNMSQIGG